LALKIIETFADESADKRTSIDSIARQLTSHALFANETWPFVTLPDFERRARLTLELAQFIGIFVLPLVTRENLEAWGNYSVANQAWYWEGMELQARTTGFNATSSGVEHFDTGLEVTPEIYVFDKSGPEEPLKPVTNEEGPFFPTWQYTPQIPVPVINADFRTLPEATAELNAYLENDARRSLAGRSFEFEVGSAGGVFLDLLLERWQGGGNIYRGGPLAYYFKPLYDRFEPPFKLVGVIQSFIYWHTYFEGLLPAGVNGIVLVLENTCNQTYSFSLFGGSADFIGAGDRHDAKYDYLEESTDYGVFLQRSPDDIDGDTGGCFYRLRLYPSQEMKDLYVTNEPLIIGLTIMGVFVFTILAFVLYDRFVEKRQRLVMKSAKQTSDVVNKLFPEAVRERLYESDAKARDADGGPLISGSTTTGSNGCSPIADEYPNCTVFFADLAGKWAREHLDNILCFIHL
jgi:hypothetical protein